MTPLPTFAQSSGGVGLQRALLTSIPALIDEALTIQQIPAPTFDEARRAAYIRSVFEAIPALRDIHVDALHNVYSRLPGRDSARPALLISAHTDTVFPIETDLTYRRTEQQLHAPGIGDNSLGVAGLLGVLRLLQNHPIESDIWFIANTREEGLGDLGGIRAVVDRLHGRIGACIVIEGMAFGQIYHAGIAVRRLRIHAQTAGGHSWLHFGQPSAIHELVKFAGRLTTLQVPTTPRTTYNIGLIEGGRSVNTIATDASLTLDLRSESSDTLAVLEKQVMLVLEGSHREGVLFRTEVVGDRPAGAINASHPLVHLAREALDTVKMTPILHTGSTDANYPLAKGIPAVTVGITSGGNAHRLDEYIDLPPIARGMWQLVLLTIAAAGSLT